MAAEEEQPKCPVDHSTRDAWLKRQKEQTAAAAAPAEEKCPVDHSARLLWLEKMGGSSTNPHSKPAEMAPRSTTTTAPHAIEVATSESCASDKIPDNPVLTSDVSLPDERMVSSIPRTGAGSNWIYPSQKQFFELMKRKSWNPQEEDMPSVVPIHNLVNERAWSLIQMWERGQGAEKCGGVQLTSFKGDSKKLTPRARWKLFWGYERPFDRHDWTINRCGTEIDYVIDFYSGKSENSQVPSFYLDVRPKLNSFEGFRMRLLKAFGW